MGGCVQSAVCYSSLVSLFPCFLFLPVMASCAGALIQWAWLLKRPLSQYCRTAAWVIKHIWRNSSHGPDLKAFTHALSTHWQSLKSDVITLTRLISWYVGQYDSFVWRSVVLNHLLFSKLRDKSNALSWVGAVNVEQAEAMCELSHSVWREECAKSQFLSRIQCPLSYLVLSLAYPQMNLERSFPWKKVWSSTV